MAAEDWTAKEVEETVEAYFRMLREELRGVAFVKARRNRELRERLENRSRGSVEFKHQNISAVLSEEGAKYIQGYKPRFNYQGLLRDVVVRRLEEDRELLDEIEEWAKSTTIANPDTDILKIMDDDPPHREGERESRVFEGRSSRRPPRDFVALQERNAALGEAGEKLAMDFERGRLRRAGHEGLADQVEQVSRTQGDWMGFDVLSFEEDGSPRFIEVKATHFGAYTPFFVSENQVRKSRRHQERYYLYRAYDMRVGPRMYRLHGALDEVCELSPLEWRARVG